LNDDEKVRACVIAKVACADFVKTSTGFGPGGATAADVALMRRVVGPDMGVKAAGGVRDLKAAQAMIGAGADRIGGSVGVKVVQGSRGGKSAEPSAKGYWTASGRPPSPRERLNGDGSTGGVADRRPDACLESGATSRLSARVRVSGALLLPAPERPGVARFSE